MPRRRVSNNPATNTPQAKTSKRHYSSSAAHSPPITTSGSRRSKRIKSYTEGTRSTAGKNVTSERSKYFEGPNSDEDSEEAQAGTGSIREEEEASGYEEGDVSDSLASIAPSSAPFPYSEEAYNSDDAPKRRRKKLANGRKSGRASADTQSTAGGVVERDKELWREGVKAGLGPGKAIFIERPRPRGDGGIKYVPGRIHPNTMAFLGDLKANNEREWLKSQ